MNRMLTHGRLALVTLGACFGMAMFSGCGPTYPNCDNDEQCHEGEFCINGRCQDCRDDSHCPRGQRCTAYTCEPTPGWCEGDSDCPADQECVDNFCRPRPVVAEVTPPTPMECQLAPVYFAFDESTLDESGRSALQANITCMQERSITSVMITGMTDPRGTEEYNMALGDRRARTTRDHYQRLGLDRGAAQTRSVGEEQATGMDESSWARDRRADTAPR